jgi:hypothetical protein
MLDLLHKKTSPLLQARGFLLLDLMPEQGLIIESLQLEKELKT